MLLQYALRDSEESRRVFYLLDIEGEVVVYTGPTKWIVIGMYKASSPRLVDNRLDHTLWL